MHKEVKLTTEKGDHIGIKKDGEILFLKLIKDKRQIEVQLTFTEADLVADNINEINQGL